MWLVSGLPPGWHTVGGVPCGVTVRLVTLLSIHGTIAHTAGSNQPIRDPTQLGDDPVVAEHVAAWDCKDIGRHNEVAYTQDLLDLEMCIPAQRQEVNRCLTSIRTPLQIGQWERALVNHPDQEFVSFLLRGMRGGFRIGYNRRGHSCKPVSRNMQSARLNPQVVEEYLAKEASEGRVIGPLDPTNYPQVQVSPFGVIPKPHQPGKWRLIVDLSSPEGQSVNDGIAKDLCSVAYISVDDIAAVVLRLGRGAKLAKIDIRAAYRIIPVHPDDRCLLGMRWEGQLFIDATLPFGLRSAPKLFTAVADALEWMVKSKGVRFLSHYLDDFIIVGAPDSEKCKVGLEQLLDSCKVLGIQIATHKVEGPLTCIMFLGIEVDTKAMELRLPPEKLQRLKEMIEKWRSRKSCTKEELESLVGHLSHACKVVRPGRRFLRGMIELLTVAKRRHHHIRLSSTFRADLEWWHAFLNPWNGVSVLYKRRIDIPDVQIWSDASGSWGCAAVWGNQWLLVSWQQCPSFETVSIAAKAWYGCVVEGKCDNETVVHILNHGYTNMAHLLRCLFFIEAKLNFTLRATHVPGVRDPRADSLSRNRLKEFVCFISTGQPRCTCFREGI